MRIVCGFRNCNNEFDWSLEKIYCSKSCKSKESVYKSRDNKPKKKRGPKVKVKRLTRMSEEELKKVSEIWKNIKENQKMTLES